MLKWQDIQIQDKEEWENLQSLWANGRYTEAIAVLEEASIKYKWLDANTFNELTNFIVQVENLNDPSFKSNLPLTAPNPPQNPSNGNIWFQTVG